jgi:hypothetical protein
VKHADQQRFKEERKIIAGYSSGRRAPEMIAGEDGKTGQSPEDENGERDPEEEGRELVSDNALKVFVRSFSLPPPSLLPLTALVRWRPLPTMAWSPAWNGGTKRSSQKIFAKHGSDLAPNKKWMTSTTSPSPTARPSSESSLPPLLMFCAQVHPTSDSSEADRRRSPGRAVKVVLDEERAEESEAHSS